MPLRAVIVPDNGVISDAATSDMSVAPAIAFAGRHHPRSLRDNQRYALTS